MAFPGQGCIEGQASPAVFTARWRDRDVGDDVGIGTRPPHGSDEGHRFAVGLDDELSPRRFRQDVVEPFLVHGAEGGVEFWIPIPLTNPRPVLPGETPDLKNLAHVRVSLASLPASRT